MVSLRLVGSGFTLGALGLALHLSDSPAGARGAAAAAAVPHAVVRRGPSCPLSVGEQVKAVDAFARMMPTFRHPRCINCHGALDIYSSNHKGANDLDPNIGRMTDFVKWRAQCQDCHDVLPRSPMTGDTASGWITPPSSRFFVDSATGVPKSAEELCVQMKELEKPGSRLISHLHDDHGDVQFIAAGYVGDRALGPQGLKDHSVVVQPAPGTQAELTQMARDWLATMGGDYVGDPECGCEKPKLELTMTTHVTGVSQGQALSGEAHATVTLTPDTMGVVYSGEAPLRHGRYTSPPLPKECTITYAPSGGTLAVKEARVDTASGGAAVVLLLHLTNSGGGMTVRCANFPQPMTMPILPVAQEWRLVHEPDRVGLDYRIDGFVVPAAAPTGVGRTLVASKTMTRTTQQQGVAVTAKTTFELWSPDD